MQHNRLVFYTALVCLLGYFPATAQRPGSANTAFLKGDPFHNITLEVSLKPFKKNDKAYIRKTAEEMFTQWFSLLRHTDTVSIMLWTADGSEILDYSGNLSQHLEWARYIGNPNTGRPVGSGPKTLSLHERAYYYMEHPPEFTYGDLKYIISVLKETGRAITGKPIRVGATFDPGPEFAKSPFKYERHREILGGSAMGKSTFVSCYSVLHADTVRYAGFPRGIPDNTPFGTFFGRQSRHFLQDLGYDYLWLSNGFGFGVEGWSSTGAVFTGKGFLPEKLGPTRARIMQFWNLFRRECPGFPIQTRGTNLSTGIDLARDGVDLKGIYEGGYDILPPPNSPWAALDGDFGLEMVGYMSRIAQLPDNRFLFRYYTHDPWWLNSPWLDRYGREPHDIYLPMSVSRIDSAGKIGVPTHLNFLSIDNSYGEMPTQVPDEVIPHILKARYDEPTAPGPLVWVYPFDEYHRWAYHSPERLPEVYYGDWFIRQAINNGFPLNTVVSTTAFQRVSERQPRYFRESILVSVAPDAGSALEQDLIRYVKNGGRLIVYGPADRTGPAFRELLNLKNVDPLEGRFRLSTTLNEDELESKYPDSILHRSLFCGGGISTLIKDTADPYTKLVAKMEQNGKIRHAVWTRKDPSWNGGRVVYVRGTNSASFLGGKLLLPDNPKKWFPGAVYLRYVLGEFGIDYGIAKKDPQVKSPIMTVSRNDNGFFFSGYVPNTTVRQSFKFPQGAPLLTGFQTELKEGRSVYYLPTAWHRECRIFVQQPAGMLSCKELHSGEIGISRRFQVTGLDHATVVIYPPADITKDKLRVYLNAGYPWKTGKKEFIPGESSYGKSYEAKDVTGTLTVAW
ncbi:hypothetical protein [Compostibacter hankyongensis]|uniref:Beta-galactosidase trimerisation domain-containing protein n=1 Tax=Compostibacter hankyongensis TaxID=1007089 RepID=A0ABP8G3T4_9BACT